MKKLLIPVLLLLAAACADRTWEEDQVILRLESVSYPDSVVAGFPELYRLTVQLSGYDAGDEVHCDLSGTAADYSFALSDDGDALFADTSDIIPAETGDNIPGDGIYTRELDLGALAEGEYALLFEVRRDGAPYDDTDGAFTVLVDQPPLVVVLEHPDSLHSGFASATLLFRIVDPDPGDEIALAELVDTALPLAPLPLTMLDDTTAFIELDSTFGAWRQGLRELVVTAEDLLGLAGSDTFEVWIGNNPPALSDLTFWELPECDTTQTPEMIELEGDTLVNIVLPTEGVRCFHMTMSVMEEQGWLDFDYATCWLWDIDDEVYTSIPVPFSDDGITPDDIASDGIFTAGFHITDGNNPDEYYFEIHAADNVGQHSDTLTTRVHVLAPEGVVGAPCSAGSLFPNPFRGGER